MIVPAIAVPNDEPRLETLRDSPEISPCSASGKLDWTTLTEGVSIAPTPRPIRNSPGTNAQTLVRGLDEAEQEPDPGDRDDEAGDDQRPLRVAASPRRSAASDEMRMPTRRRGEDRRRS